MKLGIELTQLINLGMQQDQAENLINVVNEQMGLQSSFEMWQWLTQTILSSCPFDIHLYIFNLLFPHWRELPESAPAWGPTEKIIESANISLMMRAHEIQDVAAFHRYSVEDIQHFWQATIAKLNIKLDKPYQTICDLSAGVKHPQWLKGATLNIANSCLRRSNQPALIYYDQSKKIQQQTYAELDDLTNQITNSLLHLGVQQKDAIGIIMPMNEIAVAIYLAIIKLGCVVVSIADSFSSEEIATRLKIADVKLVFTQGETDWLDKKIPLYQKIAATNVARIVVSLSDGIPLRSDDLAWEKFLTADNKFTAISCNPMDTCQILFSSGTTGMPKAIPWSHVTAIKAASDGFYHQNIQTNDVICWPTNLGWMMGPWLIYAALINQACIALYQGAPKDHQFGQFVVDAKVTILGVVPTLVSHWRKTACMEKLNWDQIKLFTSTGECSNPEDMLYLMSLANYKPIIEYCGGTEIGGAYVSSTVIEKNYPSLFSTPTMGLDFIIMNEHGEQDTIGEVAIIPPAIGLSINLLNADHEKIYYTGMPYWHEHVLRRHGDQIRQLSNKYFMMLGRIDDAINLGGIKISAVEIERVLASHQDVKEIAAIGISINQGPSQLILFIVPNRIVNKGELKQDLQKQLNKHLNPLFKIFEIKLLENLPKTASNKIIRKELKRFYS